MITKCDYCGKEFNKIKSRIGKTKHNFCCRECKGKFFRKTNEIILNGDICTIIINSKKYGIIETIIDTEDFIKVCNFNWRVFNDKNRNFYIRTSIKGKDLRLHRYIMNCPSDMVVDHINHNTLDNRKCNLRICTVQENLQNLKLKNNNIEQVSKNSFRIRFVENGKRYSFNGYKSYEEALSDVSTLRIKYKKFA